MTQTSTNMLKDSQTQAGKFNTPATPSYGSMLRFGGARAIGINAASLVCGFVGNMFLLFNFTRRVRYITALPCTIILWYLATGFVSYFSSKSSIAVRGLILVDYSSLGLSWPCMTMYLLYAL